MIIGNNTNGGAKVLDVTKYMDKHPGGAEILMEFAGKNADDMFEDIGHSTEAREAMKDLIIGTVPGDAGAAPKTSRVPSGSEPASKGGLNPLAILALLVAILVGFYFSQK